MTATTTDREWADALSPADCELIVHAALRAGDARAVHAALHLLASKDPRRAGELLGIVKLALLVAKSESTDRIEGPSAPADAERGTPAAGPVLRPALAALLRSVLEESGRTQAEVAAAIGVSAKHLNQMLKGKVWTRPETVDAFLAELGLRIVVSAA